jgi:predicted dehydrogenase
MSVSNNDPIRVGIIGLGRSGWGIHANALANLSDCYRVVAVTDANPQRRDEAVHRFECRAYEDFTSFIQHPGLELTVIATPSQLHVPQTLHALERGVHVICEKPVATSSNEMNRLIAAAERSDRILAPFQNRRYEAMYRKICEVIASGKLGRIIEIRVSVHHFGRRWDWQTLREFGGGQLNNAGSHFLDELLPLFGDSEPRVFCRMDRALASGDAEDCVKVILYGDNAPLIDLEISSACAYPSELWLVTGTSGGLTSEGDSLRWKYVDFSKMPPRPVERIPEPNREYNAEQLNWTEETWTVPDGVTILQTHLRFYEDLYQTLRAGAPLVITAQSVARQIIVMERCRESADLFRTPIWL